MKINIMAGFLIVEKFCVGKYAFLDNFSRAALKAGCS